MAEETRRVVSKLSSTETLRDVAPLLLRDPNSAPPQGPETQGPEKHSHPRTP